MVVLSKSNQELILDLQNQKIPIVIKSFLVRTLGFKKNNKNEYKFSGKINPDLVESIVEFFSEFNISLKLDTETDSIYKINIKERENFEELREKGLEIKQQSISKFSIPELQEGISLKKYQIMPIKHAIEIGNVANFSVPGSGKTWMAYATYFSLKSKNQVNKLLIISPLSAFRPWENEYHEMTGKNPINIVRISGSHEKRRETISNSDFYEIFLISYNSARIEIQLLEEFLQNEKFMVVLDESHHIKNPDSASGTAVLQLARYAKHKMILSGTPIPNKLNDLWSQFTFLYPSEQLLGSYDDFKFNLDNEDSVKRISELLSPFYTRVSKNMLDLPPSKTIRVKIPMSKLQKRIYDAIRGFVKENDEKYREDALAVRRWRRNTMIYLLEAASDPSLLTKNTQYLEGTLEHEGLSITELIDEYQKFERPKKLESVKKLAEETITKNKKVIVWCNFVASIHKLGKMLENFNPVMIWGEVPKDEEEDQNYNREKEIEKFKTQSDHNLLIANPASLAESVSLHKVCHNAIYLDRTFNGGHYLQSLERIHRIGMEKNTKTKYTIFLSTNSIDEIIDDRLEQKKNRLLNFLNEEEIRQLNLELDYDNAFGEGNELDEDYKAVFEHVQKL